MKHLLTFLFLLELLNPKSLFSQDFFLEELIMPSSNVITEKKIHEIDGYFKIKFKITPLGLKKGDGKGLHIKTKDKKVGYFFAINDDNPVQVWDFKKEVNSAKDSFRIEFYNLGIKFILERLRATKTNGSSGERAPES